MKLVGMRVGDPYTEQAEHFSPSTANFPAFMRVYPIFLWSFEHGELGPIFNDSCGVN